MFLFFKGRLLLVLLAVETPFKKMSTVHQTEGTGAVQQIIGSSVLARPHKRSHMWSPTPDLGTPP